MRVQLRRAVAGAAIGRGCQWSPLQSGHAAALPVPHRADTGPAADVAAGVRVLPGGVQRRAACPRQGIPGRDKAVGQRDSAAGDHPGQDHCGAGLAGRASQCGVGAVGQRLPSCVAQLLRLMLRQAGRRYGWSATHEIQEGSSAVVSAHAQRIQRPAEWAVVCGEGGRGAGALVARPARQNRRVSRSSGNRTATTTPVSSSTSSRHRCRRWRGRPGWMWASPGWRRSRPPTGRAPRLRTRNTWPASCASCGGWSGRSPAGRKDQPTGKRRGARSPSRTTRWPGLGGTITTSRLWRWFARNQVIHVEDLNIVGMVRNRLVGTSYQRCRVGAIRANRRREGRPLRAHRAVGVALAGVEQDVLGVRPSSRRTAVADPHLDMPVVRCGPRPRPQRRQGHSRRRAGGETKRLWSPGKSPQHSGGTER